MLPSFTGSYGLTESSPQATTSKGLVELQGQAFKVYCL